MIDTKAIRDNFGLCYRVMSHWEGCETTATHTHCAIAKLCDEVDRLRAEKEDLRQRNELLRKRLDLHPKALRPRLAILNRLDEATAEVDRLRAELQAERSMRLAEYRGDTK